MGFAVAQDSPDAEITLREITRDTVRTICDLKVSIEQTQFVAPNSVSLAEAHFSDEAWFRAIYADETPVGFVMLEEIPKEALHFLWRFMIDKRYQGRGYGRRGLELVVQHLKERPNSSVLLTSYRDGKGSPRGFYKKMGFEETGEKLDNGEPIMKLKLT